MSNLLREPESRNLITPRPMTIEVGVSRYAEGSVLIKAGNTHVWVTASIEESVPDWLKGKGQGWITAEYSMLPRSTHTRTRRDRKEVSGRTQEIQRLIGRALRAMVDLKQLGERSLMVDCDVLQADGGTRTTSITGACVAVAVSLDKLIKSQKITRAVWKDSVAAISLGILKDQILVDLDYKEDSSCEVDINFVATGQGQFIEVQGTGEHGTFSQKQLTELSEIALNALKNTKELQLDALKKAGVEWVK